MDINCSLDCEHQRNGKCQLQDLTEAYVAYSPAENLAAAPGYDTDCIYYSKFSKNYI